MYNRIILILLSFFSVFLANAQESSSDSLKIIEYQKPSEYTIDTIVITGVKFLDQRVLVNMSGLTLGGKIAIPGDDISNTIRKFWEHGLFEDVQISSEMIGDGKVNLNIYLKERPRISKFNIEGISKSDKDDLKEKLNIRAGTQATENVINDALVVIKKFYKEKGFFNVEIDVIQENDSARQNSVSLTLKVDKNKRVKIHDIIFSGNTQIDSEKLRTSMKKTKRRDWKFWNSSKYIEGQYKEDKGLLIDYYNEKGYRDAKIIADSIRVVYTYGDWYIDKGELEHRTLFKFNPDTTYEIKKTKKHWYSLKSKKDTIIKVEPKKRVNIYIDLSEGKKYYFRNVSWVGNTKYPGEFLSTVLGIKKGDVFDQKILNKRLQEDEDAVSSLYLDNGYLFFNVMPVEVMIENDSIDFEMRIFEGKQATISNVIISGNTKTNEHVVRRELRTMPGELFSKSDIVRSVRELATLGHFEPEKIQPVPLPNPENSTVDIEYKLVERANDQLEVSGGWGGYYGFIGTVGIRFSNFSYRNFFKWKEWRPVPSGDGQSLSLRFQSSGTYYRSFSVSFADPWFGNKKPNSLSVSVYLNRISRTGNMLTASDIRMNTYGMSIGLGRRLQWPDDYFSLQNQVNFEAYDIKNYTLPGLKYRTGTLNNVNYSITLMRNSLDQFIYPRTGSSLSLRLQITPPFSLFRKDNFWKLSQSEIDAMYAENSSRTGTNRLSRPQMEEEVILKEESIKYKWIEYHKWTFKAETYTSLVGNLVLMTRLNFGYLGRFNNKFNYSPVEKFEMGGSGLSSYSYFNVDIVPMRGYEDQTLSTVYNPETRTWDDNSNVYNKFTLELRYPVTLKEQATIYGLAFMEAGNSWYDIKSFNPYELKRTAGIGVRVFLPMFGMLGFDVGYGFDSYHDRYGKLVKGGSWVPQFIMGQQF